MLYDRIIVPRRSTTAPQLFGGKAEGLWQLQRANISVPPWFCLTTRVFDALVTGQLATRDRRELLSTFDRTLGPSAKAAVRSSAVGEDGTRISLAGRLRSFLNVTRDDLIRRVEECFASCCDAEVAGYLAALGEGGEPLQAAVIVQEMVEGRVSGVLFTANPATGDRGELVITAGRGPCSGVVADQVSTETYRVDRTAKECSVDVRSDGTGTSLLDVADVHRLAELGERIENHFGRPVDVEWTIDGDGRLHVLQARPITALPEEQLFDNTNIVESFPGVTLPLTFSFTRAANEETFRTSWRRLGVNRETLEEHRRVFQTLVASIHGRIYYNIASWYQLFSIVPGFEQMIPAWEQSIGLTPARHTRLAPACLRRRLVTWFQLARLFLRHPRNLRRFDDEVARHSRWLNLTGMREEDPVQFWSGLERMFRELCGAFSITVVNDLFTNQLIRMIDARLERLHVPGRESLRNRLLCAGEVESVTAVRSLTRIAGQLAEHADLVRILESDCYPAVIWHRLQSESPETVRRALHLHLERYGDRMLHDLKLERPPCEEQPEFFVSLLRQYVAHPSSETEENDTRRDAEQELNRRLAGRPLAGFALYRLIHQCRLALQRREHLRLARSRAFALARRAFRRMGALLVGAGRLESEQDVYLLTVEELAGQVDCTAASTDLRALVELRRREYAGYEQAESPSRVAMRRLTPTCRESAGGAADTPAAADGLLTGSPCSPGRVVAPAMRVTEPEAGLNARGKVIVATSTDPGWAFLLVGAAGLVVERGNLLSHTAIICRELGVPTVIGVPSATRLIDDGELVELDGTAGTVRLADTNHAAMTAASGSLQGY